MTKKGDIRMGQTFKCCICGHDFMGHGNNPRPYKDSGICCNLCHELFVVPERIKLAEEYEKKDKDEN